MADPRAIAKVFGNNIPAPIAAGEAAAQMTPASPFSPGTPIGPYDGFSRTPRSQNFVTGYNISTRPRAHERVAFETLKGLIKAYDVAQMAIWHRIDSIRSLEWSLIAKKGHGGDITDVIPVGMAALAKPDRQQPFSVWLAAWLYDILAFDAGALSRIRNRRGDAIGLRVIDGTMVAPLLDYWGNSPEPPTEAYVQYANGLPWNWLTRNDLIYLPFRKLSESPYGQAPLETILLNANTDLRFQQYFLQRFTEGNIPAGFASAPETWTPDQIEQFQTYWDAFMLGDQAAKHQIKWLPGGSKLEWSNEKDFSDHFSLFLMRKTCAAYHVVPSDLGFTESVNKSSGESQADVQHRVGDLPLLRHIQVILSSFLQDDLGLPLAFAFDLGEEQADRLQQAQADKIYVELGAISSSDIREMRYGLPEPDGQPVPRYIYTTHAGPIPLASLLAVAGQVDPSTGAPAPGTALPHTVFGGVEGVMPSPPIKNTPLAEQVYGFDAMPPAPPPQPVEQVSADVAKDGAPTAGITAATGITSYDLIGRRGDEDDESDDDREQLAKSELVAFRSFRKTRQRAGRWRDFEFRSVDAVRARRLNQAGRADVRKASGEVAVAGLAVQAADTGRVLMLQRALDPEDPASGCWEMPGGHIEGNESPLQGAWREFAEETGCIPPPGEQTGTWTSPNGIYQGIVWTVPSESFVPVGDRDQVSNPDDPDGDQIEAIAWWDPEQLPGNPAVRQELLDNLDAVLAALGVAAGGDESACPCGTPVVYDEANGWQHADGSISHEDGESVSDKMRTVAKAAAPKGDASDLGASTDWPGWDLDEDAADYWADRIRDALTGVLSGHAAREMASDYLATEQPTEGDPDKEALTSAALAWLATRNLDIETPLAALLPGVHTDGYLIGLTAAHATVNNARPQLGGWAPGDTENARQQVDGLGGSAGLDELLDTTPATAQEIADTRRKDLARELVKGLLAGVAVNALADALTGALARLDTAVTIALTEITRSSGLAALFGYQQLGVNQVRWLIDPSGKICPRCLANAGAGTVPIGSTFPSGDRTVPAHPRCRCAVVSA